MRGDAGDGRRAFVDGLSQFRGVAGAAEVDDRYSWHSFILVIWFGCLVEIEQKHLGRFCCGNV